MKRGIQAVWSVGVMLMLMTANGCGAQYKAMSDAAHSELTPVALARDDRHKIQLHKVLVEEEGFAGLTLAMHVFMERAYIVGHVDSREQGAAVLQAARKVPGLRSVEGYLPVKESPPNDASSTSNVALKAEIASALALTPEVVKSRVHVEVLDGHVVLLGVVSGNEERRSAEKAAAGVKGVKDVTNWLLLPEKEYMSIRPHVR